MHIDRGESHLILIFFSLVRKTFYAAQPVFIPTIKIEENISAIYVLLFQFNRIECIFENAIIHYVRL